MSSTGIEEAMTDVLSGLAWPIEDAREGAAVILASYEFTAHLDDLRRQAVLEAAALVMGTPLPPTDEARGDAFLNGVIWARDQITAHVETTYPKETS